MGRSPGARCTICNHPQRVEIDKALISGATYREIAQKYGVSKDALYRHRKNGHIAEQIAKVARKKEIKQAREIASVVEVKARNEAANAETLLQQITSLKDRALTILDNAEREGTREACLALGEVRRTLEFLAKITGELQDGKPAVNVTVNLLQSPEFKQVLVVLDEELPDKYRERIARRLYALDT